ncbi:MAG: acyltransferase domain-containing protein [Deltaproteobacteria bacterium]|nr:acyltransferase domain-containing protein [Deltaproteobacteria bacterium]
MSHEEPRVEQDAIAIIGMAARMPGAANLDAFWRNLRDGVESISHFSEEELLESGLDLATIRQPNFIPAKGIMADVEQFDASFFGIAPREAEIMDPQHRLLMECAWEVMEHAGYDSESYAGRIAVYTSTGMNTYLPVNILSNPGLAESVGGFQLSIYNDKDFVPTRIAYSMNLKGPGVDIGTACSSSLVSLHFACQNLLTYQCDMAIVGAVSVHFPVKVGHLCEEGAAYSPDGHCRPFDATRSGLIDGNGMGAVVLKRLSDALADGDYIHAVIKGTAINNDGSLKVGYAAPSIDGQARVIIEAQALAGCPPDTISYIEAHGTATPLGDPIEVKALTQAFRVGTQRKGFCGLGSVKSNIGHVDKAAGLAGLIKTTLALKHDVIPPSLHFTAPNPKLNLPDSPFHVVNKLQPWPKNADTPRRAGISSFGVGGTNAHAVIEEAPPVAPSSPSRPVQVLMVSAKTEAAVEAATENLATFLEQAPDMNLSDVCYTLQQGRRPFVYRRAVVCTSGTEGVKALRASQFARVADATNRGVVFLFPGQGSQYPGMGHDLYRHEPVFRDQVDQCAHYLEPELQLDIRTLLFPAAEEYEEAATQLAQTALTQPALFTIEYALAQLWMSWGVQPRAMIGHSLGEYVAACIAGVFSLQDALTLITARGRMMQKLPSGAMLAVPLAEKELQPLLGAKIDLAAVNGPQLCVVSGPEREIAALDERLTKQGLSCRLLHTSHAFHSAMMEPMLQPFTSLVRSITLKPPQSPYLSNLTGQWITEAQATQPEYWAQHLRHTVRFAAGISCLLDSEPSVLLEVGPGRTLCDLASQVQSKHRAQCLPSLPHAREKRGAQQFVLQALAELWMTGANMDWAGFYQHERRQRVPLPTYPFQRRRYWIDPAKQVTMGTAESTATGKKPDVADWFYLPSWKATLTPVAQLEAMPADTCWLVFADEHGLAAALAAELVRVGHSVVSVRKGAGFARKDAQTYTVNPTEPADFVTLCKDLHDRQVLPQRILYLWGTTSDNRTVRDPHDIGDYCGGLLSIVQAFTQQSSAQPVELLVVANQMRDVSGETSIDPAKAALLGPLSTIPWEHPGFTCRAIDIPSPGLRTWQLPSLVTRLMSELGGPAAERIVALRAGQRWIADLDPVRLEIPSAEKNLRGSGLLRDGGVYVITGGLYTIGLQLARQIATMVHAKLVLTACGPTTGNGSQPSAAALAPIAPQLQELESLGCEVLPLHLERFDTLHLEDALRHAERRFGRISGVIHAEDMSSARLFSFIQDLDPTARDHYWNEQRQTLVALTECLQEREVSFCMVMSSLASEVGGVGQVAHTTASVYLDAFTQWHHQQTACPLMVVNWDMWNTEEDRVPAHSGLATLAMTPAEGAHAFQRMLYAGTFARILVSTTDPRLRHEVIRTMHAKHATLGPTEESNGLTGATRDHARPDLLTPYAQPRSDDETVMAELWQECLGIDRIGIHDNFFDLGGHSLLATKLVSRLQQTFQVRMELDIFFSSPTIAELTEALLHQQLEQNGGDQMTHLLDRLEELTEEEAEALLNSNSLPTDLLAALADEISDDRNQ